MTVSRSAPGGEVHHRVADVADLHVEDGHDVPAGVVELARVPDDRRLPPVRHRRVAPQPREGELDERVGQLLHRAVVRLVARHPEGAGLGRRRGAHDAGVDERLERQGVEPGEDLEVLVDDRVALGVGGLLEVAAPADAVHHVGRRLVDPAVHLGHRDPMFVHDRLEAHLVLQREDQRHVGAVAAHAERPSLAVGLDVGPPHGTPTGLALDADDLTAEPGPQPVAHPRRVGVGLSVDCVAHRSCSSDVAHLPSPRQLPDRSEATTSGR